MDSPGPACELRQETTAPPVGALPLNAEDGHPTPTPAGDFLGPLSELREYVSFLIAAQVDGVKARLRALVLQAFLLGLLFFTLCVLILIGSVLTFAGLAQGLGALCGEQVWIGSLASGLLLLGAVGLGLNAGVAHLNRRALERTRERYEKRKSAQLARFGRGVGPAQ